MSLLTSRRASWLVVAAAVLVSLPGLSVGLFNDDYLHRLVLSPGGSHDFHGGPLTLYEFLPRTPGHTAALRQTGAMPWWVDPDLAMSFFRPLSSLSLAADVSLFGSSMLGAHLHSILWFAVLAASVHALFRRILPPALSTVAALIYAVAGYHAMASAWIASRHVLLAATFAVLAVLFHVRRREDAYRPGLWLSPLLFAASLLCSESGLGAIALLGAYEAFGAPGDRRARITALAPAAIVAVVYLGAYVALGYGVRASGGYLDPFREPLAFLPELLTRSASLLADALLAFPSDLWGIHAIRPALVVVGVVAVVLVAFGYRVVRPSIPQAERRAVTWLGVGSLAALLPVLPGFVGGRLLVLPGLGAAVLLASIIVHGWRAPLRVRVVAIGLAVVHFGLSPLARLAQESQFAAFSRAEARVASDATIECAPGAMAHVIGASDFSIATYGALILTLHRGIELAGWRNLLMVPHDLSLTRTSASSFELEIQGGSMLETAMERVYRRPSNRFAPDDEVRLSDLVVRVVAVSPTGPTRVAFAFDSPLDDPRRCFVTWRDGALHPLRFPAVGESVLVRRELGPMGM
jgi:hypothetical protein